MNYTNQQKLASEYVGTALLLATVVGSGIMGDSLSPDNTAIALLGNTIATGAILFVLITMFGPIGGAHFNPAVTLGFLLRKEIAPGMAGAYVVTQILGAVSGVIIAHLMFDLSAIQFSTNERTGASQWLAEAVATFGLLSTIFVVLKHRDEAVPLAVGLYITAGYWFTASTSFANPAVTIARGFTNTFSGIAPPDVPGFIIAQLAGAIVATYFCLWLLRSSDATAE